MLMHQWHPEYWIADIGNLSKSDTALYANTETNFITDSKSVLTIISI